MQETELQQIVQRQAAQFCERVSQALTPLEDSPRRVVSDTAMRGSLLYVSSAVDIATGPLPEINLLDMLVFLRLCRTAVERHFIPEVYREQGAEVVAAFCKSEEDFREIAAHVIDEPKRRELEVLIDEWIAANPEQYRVEGVRLDDFSHQAGKLARERAERAKGLLSGVKSATRAADQALLLAERGMFLVNRLPFLLRLQIRLGAREIVSDALGRLSSVPAAIGNRIMHALARARRCS